MRAPRIKKEAVETRIRTEEARRVPGTQGDTLRSCRTCPASARSSFGSGAAHRLGLGAEGDRGSTSTASRSRRSITSAACARPSTPTSCGRSISSPGSYGAEYGRGLGGLVRIELAPAAQGGRARLRGRRRHGRLGAAVDRGLTPRLRAGRRRALSATSTGCCRWSPRRTSATSSPSRATTTTRRAPRWRCGQDEELALTFLGLGRSPAAHHPLRRSGRASARRTPTASLQAADRPLHAPAARRRQRRRDAVDRLRHQQPPTSSFGGTPVDAQPRAPGSTRCARATAARSRRATTLSFGLDMQAQSSALDRIGSVNLPAREGDIVVFGQPPGDDIAADHWNVHGHRHRPVRHRRDRPRPADADPRAALRARRSSKGARSLPAGGTSAAHRVRQLRAAGEPRRRAPQQSVRPRDRRAAVPPNPRLIAAFRATRRLTFTAGGGIYGQPPDPEDMSAGVRQPDAEHVARGARVGRRSAYKLRPR